MATPDYYKKLFSVEEVIIAEYRNEHGYPYYQKEDKLENNEKSYIFNSNNYCLGQYVPAKLW
jgi:hypothetical protein